MCGGCEDEKKSCILYVKQRGPLASSVGLFPRPKLGDYRSLVGSGVCHGATESPGQQDLWYGEAWTPGTLALTLPSKQQQVQGKRGRREPVGNRLLPFPDPAWWAPLVVAAGRQLQVMRRWPVGKAKVRWLGLGPSPAWAILCERPARAPLPAYWQFGYESSGPSEAQRPPLNGPPTGGIGLCTHTWWQGAHYFIHQKVLPETPVLRSPSKHGRHLYRAPRHPLGGFPMLCSQGPPLSHPSLGGRQLDSGACLPAFDSRPGQLVVTCFTSASVSPRRQDVTVSCYHASQMCLLCSHPMPGRAPWGLVPSALALPMSTWSSCLSGSGGHSKV